MAPAGRAHVADGAGAGLELPARVRGLELPASPTRASSCRRQPPIPVEDEYRRCDEPHRPDPGDAATAHGPQQRPRLLRHLDRRRAERRWRHHGHAGPRASATPCPRRSAPTRRSSTRAHTSALSPDSLMASAIGDSDGSSTDTSALTPDLSSLLPATNSLGLSAGSTLAHRRHRLRAGAGPGDDEHGQLARRQALRLRWRPQRLGCRSPATTAPASCPRCSTPAAT